MRQPLPGAVALAAALLAAGHALAQAPVPHVPLPATVRIFPVAGTDTTGSMTLATHDQHLEVDLDLAGLPPDRPFALHFADEGRCFSGPDALATAGAIVVTPSVLRADANGKALLHFSLEDLTLDSGHGSITRYPLGIYTTPAEGAAALACGSVRVNQGTTMAVRTGPPASRDEVRACMDSEDRIVALDKRNDADKVAVESATSAAVRDALLEAWTQHEARFQAALRTHTLRCGQLNASAQDRAAILEERQDAAGLAR
jgi:hypothetical protein